MSRRIVLAWLLLVAVVAPASAQVPFGSGLVPTRTALGRIGLERQWMVTVPLSGTERLLEISIADNLLFTQTSFANFSVYNADSGQLLWTTNLGRKTGDAQPASANSFAVFATNSNRLFALDRRTGRAFWVKELENLATSPTACDEGRVMVGLTTGKLVAYGLKVKMPKGAERISEKPLTLWNWQTGGPVVARPQPAGPVIAFSSLDGRVYVVTAEGRTALWRFVSGGEIPAALGTYGTRTLLVPSSDKNVYALDLWTAETKWVFPSAAPVRQEPLVADNDAYVVNTAGSLSAVDINTGTARWTTSTHGGRLISVSGTKVYLVSHDGDMFVVDRATGQVLADPRSTLQRAGVNLRDFSLGITNHLNDRLYLGTPSGLVVCVREIGQTNPRLLRDPKAKPLGYIPPEGIDLPQVGGKVTAPAAGASGEKEKPEGDEPAPDESKEKKEKPEGEAGAEDKPAPE